jgi:excisionase family DNA binding protein
MTAVAVRLVPVANPPDRLGGTGAGNPKYGLAAGPAHPYAPPSSRPLSTLDHPMGSERPEGAQSEATTPMASMAVNELGPMLTATEVAEMLHLHVNTVKRLGDRGELPFYRVCKRGDRRFRLDDVMKFLSQNR